MALAMMETISTPSSTRLSPDGSVPRFFTPRSPERETIGPAVGQMGRLLGLPLMPSQQFVHDVAGERLESGSFAYRTVIWTGPRRMGKTVGLQARQAWRLAKRKRARLWMTAQNRDKARARFLDTAETFTDRLNTPSRQRVRALTGVGHEKMTWLSTGSTLRPFAPNAESMHGEDPLDVFADEIFVFTMAEAGLLTQAYRPGFLTNPDAQEWLTSTKGTDSSEWLNAEIKRGRLAVKEGRRTGVAFFEWSCPQIVDGVPLAELSDDVLLEVVAANHPAFGHTVSMDALAYALDEEKNGPAGRAGFIRAYANITSEVDGWKLLTSQQWRDTATEAVTPDPVGLGVATDEDGRVAVVAAGRLPSGQAVMEVVQVSQDGMFTTESGWVCTAAEFVDEVARKNRAGAVLCHGLDAQNRNLADLVMAKHSTAARLNGPDFTAACTRWLDEVRQAKALHVPSAEFDADAERLDRPRPNAAWAAGRVAVATAATLALWAADHPTVPTGRFRMFVPGRSAT